MKKIYIYIPITALLIVFNCKSPEARPPESVKSGSFIEESAERNKKLNALETAQIKTIITSNSDKNYIASESGFWYFYETKIENDTVKAQFGDILEFEYEISNLDDKEIYPKKSKTYLMDKETLFTGLREGLKLMKPTECVTFIFPSQKAFGYYGDDHKIGTNVPLICKVTLNSIIKQND